MSANARMAPATIMVLGTGLVGHAAAVALRRALPFTEVTLASMRGAPAWAEESSLLLPDALEALGVLGLNEDVLVRAGCASHRLCERFEGWGTRNFAVDPSEKPRLAGAALHHLWGLHGETPFDALSAAATLAQAGRFAPGRAADPALALDPDALLALLPATAQRIGVRLAEAVDVAETALGVAIVTLADGRRLQPDLIVDAGGSPLSAPARTLVAFRRQTHGAASLCDRYRRLTNGWHARWCAPSGDTEVIVSDNEAPAPDDGWQRVEYATMRTETPFVGRHLTLSASPGPFLRLGLSLVLRSLSLLLELLPGREPEPLLIREYNRRASELIDDAFNVVDAFAARPQSLRIEAIIGAFARHGRLPPDVGDLVGAALWQSLLIGLGTRPALPDALAASVGPAEAKAALRHLQREVEFLPARMPPYDVWLRSAKRD